MTIVRETQQVLASVDVTNAYRVELRQAHRTEEYPPADAARLAKELMTAAEQARTMHEEAGGAPREVVHRAPIDGTSVMTCCGRSPFDIDGWDRISWDRAAVTCNVPPAHGFDIAPICRECHEGKHGACDGTALVDLGSSVYSRDCGCAGAQHRVVGAGS